MLVRNKKRIFGILMAILLTMSMAFPIFSVSKAGFLGGDVPIFNFSMSMPSYGSFSLPDVGDRKYTVQELFGNSLSLKGSKGETTKKHWLWEENNVGVKELVKDDSKAVKRVEARNIFDAPVITFHSMGPSLAIQLARLNTTIMNKFVTFLFDGSFICSDPDNPTGFCINLLKLVGGTKHGGDTGIVGMFANGLFFPLVTLVLIIEAVRLIYQGLIKRRIRQAFGEILWCVGIFFISAVLFVNPYMVARLPQTVNSTFLGCTLSALNGQSCLSEDSSSTPSLFVTDMCHAKSGQATPSQKITLTVESFTCGVWKSFVLDPYVQTQWGYPITALYTQDAPDGKSVYDKSLIAGKPSDYAVNMYSAMSPSQLFHKNFTGGTVYIRGELKDTMNKDKQSDGKTHPGAKLPLPDGLPKFTAGDGDAVVYNIALRQMADFTRGNFGGNNNPALIMATASKNPVTWDSWSGTQVRGGPATLGMIGSLLCGIPIIITSLWGHIYSFMATILIAFAPLFCLFGLHSGRGKKIFLGWLEQLVTAILKFMALSLFIIIALMLISGVLKSASLIQGFVAMVVISAGISAYRNPFVELIGQCSLGGQKIKNGFKGEGRTEASKKWKQTKKKYGKASVGGLAGGALATKSLKGGLEGALKGVGHQLGRSQGIVGSGYRTAKRMTESKKKEEERKNQEEKDNKRYEEQYKQQQEMAETLDNQMGNVDQKMNALHETEQSDYLYNNQGKSRGTEQIEEAYGKGALQNAEINKRIDAEYTKQNQNIIENNKQLEASTREYVAEQVARIKNEIPRENQGEEINKVLAQAKGVLENRNTEIRANNEVQLKTSEEMVLDETKINFKKEGNMPNTYSDNDIKDLLQSAVSEGIVNARKNRQNPPNTNS